MGDVRRLIVFDLDGTLIDSRRDLACAANALIAERGGAPLPEDAIAGMVGDGAAMLVRRALTAAGLPVDEAGLPRFLALYDKRLLDATRPYPGIPEVLRELAGRGPIAVLTNKPLAPTGRLLDAFGLSPFITEALGGDGPLPRKPNPAALIALASRHGAAVTRTVMVGDSHVDVATARAAGTHLCVAGYGFGYPSIAAGTLRAGDAVVHAPEGLPQAIDGLLQGVRL